MPTEIRVLQQGDEDILLNVAPAVFDRPPEEKLCKEFLADPRHHIVVAMDHGVIVGFASGVHYIHPDKAPELWINEVSVAPTHRGRGLARAVLNQLMQVARAHNCTTAWVLTYRNNTAAQKLYKSLGGTDGADQSGPPDALVGYSFALGEARVTATTY